MAPKFSSTNSDTDAAPAKAGTPYPPPKILTRQRAWACVAINQLAFPGLGTIMAGRRIGYVQAVVMVVGFCLFIGFMLGFFFAFSRFITLDGNESWLQTYYRAWRWALWSGLGLTALAWISALISSILILRDVNR